MEDELANDTKFQPGDLIWAKMKGFPPWPAKVMKQTEDIPQRRIPVMFFGTMETSFMKPSDLFDYLSNRQQYEIPRKHKDFNKAVQEIRKEAGISVEKDVFAMKSGSPPVLPRSRRTSERYMDLMTLPVEASTSKGKRSNNSGSTKSRSRTSSFSAAFRVSRELAKRERKRLDSESSGGSRRNKMISGYADADLMLELRNDDLSALLGGHDEILGGIADDNRSWKSKRSRASSRVFDDFFGRTRNRSGSASASGRRSRLISGFSNMSDVFEELMATPADLDAHAEQFMMTINNMPSDGSVEPELNLQLPPPVEFCTICGHECRLTNGIWKCTGKMCQKYKEVAESTTSSAMDNLLLEVAAKAEAASGSQNIFANIKTEPKDFEERKPSFLLPSSSNIKTEQLSPERKRPSNLRKDTASTYDDDSEKHHPERKKKKVQLKLISPPQRNRSRSPESPNRFELRRGERRLDRDRQERERQRPRHYKVEKTPPISESGHRHCVFCNGQVRPQMCGGNRHRWRCVDKKCRKWYGWVRSYEEIPKNIGRKSSKQSALALKGATKKKKEEETPEETLLPQLKRRVGRPSKHDVKIRLKLQKELSAMQRTAAAAAPPVAATTSQDDSTRLPHQKRKYTKRKKKDAFGFPYTTDSAPVKQEEEFPKRAVSPMTLKQSKYRSSAMERRGRWWISEKRKHDPSPDRPFATEPADSAAAFKLMANAVRSASVTRADEVGTINGTLDILMDSLMGSMAPLLSLLQKLPVFQIPPELPQQLWNASAPHIPTFQ